jgi:S1-C subfamily serine protease
MLCHRKRLTMTPLRLCGHIALLILATVGLTSCAMFRAGGKKEKQGQAQEQVQPRGREEAVSGMAAAAQRVLPCVVRVVGEASLGSMHDQTADSMVTADGRTFCVGSGFFISTDGKVATANHVVAPIAGDIVVESRYTERIIRYKAYILAQDPNADIAILKVDADNCPKVDLASPVPLRLGDRIGFAGYPRMLPFPTLTEGIIAAKAKLPLSKELSARNWMVLSAFVNPGTSGGPLFLEATGRVIGVVNARRSDEIQGQAVPLPSDYSPLMGLPGMSSLSQSTESYNNNLDLIGDISRFGVGFAASAEYLLRLQAADNALQPQK